MGKVLYPEIVHKGKDGKPNKRDVGGQYAAWFNEWVGDKYRVPWKIPDESKPKQADESGVVIVVDSSKGPITFTGKMCYDLRCSLLHAGEPEASYVGPAESKGFYNTYKLEFRLHACDSYEQVWPYYAGRSEKGETKESRLISIRIDVGTLCLRICDGAELCLNNCGKDESDFPVLDIFDLRAWADQRY